MNPPSQHEEQQREQVFTALVTPWIEPLRRYLARRADPAVADDVLADTLLVLWRRAEELPDTDGLPWAIGIARWQLSNAVRGERRRRRLTARVGIVDDPARRSGDPTPGWAEQAAVRDQLATLGEGDAEILRLWAWDDLSTQQIAVSLGISANAAAIRLHRAKRKFRRTWERTSTDPDMT